MMTYCQNVARSQRLDPAKFLAFAATHSGAFVEEGGTQLCTTTLFVDKLINDFLATGNTRLPPEKTVKEAKLDEMRANWPGILQGKNQSADNFAEQLKTMDALAKMVECSAHCKSTEHAREMVTAIYEIGRDKGWTEGYDSGWSAGYDQVQY